MDGKTEKKGTFIVQILNSQNDSWQGTVTWTEKKETVPFRSVLELIQLMDSALEETRSPEPSLLDTSQRPEAPEK